MSFRFYLTIAIVNSCSDLSKSLSFSSVCGGQYHIYLYSYWYTGGTVWTLASDFNQRYTLLGLLDVPITLNIFTIDTVVQFGVTLICTATVTSVNSSMNRTGADCSANFTPSGVVAYVIVAGQCK